jgi:hypothetical protein
LVITKPKTFPAFVLKKHPQHLPPLDPSFQPAFGSALKAPMGVPQLSFRQMLSVLLKAHLPFIFSTLSSFSTDL